MSAPPFQKVFFGSSQERRLFPLHYAPDRLGNQMSRQQAPHIGPGCYDNHEFGTIASDLQKTPMSRRGYGPSARTAARFPPCNKGDGCASGSWFAANNAKSGDSVDRVNSVYLRGNQRTETPSPQHYQLDQSQFRVLPPGKAPFNSTTQRSHGMSCTAEESPGPGTYAHDAMVSRKVSWPMCFGRPDWSRLPPLEKKSLRVKLTSEKESLKHRNRVAYLSLYY